MTETSSTQPAPDPSVTVPSAQDAHTGPVVTPPADPPAKKAAPAKKATSGRAAKKAAPPPADAKKDVRSLYLPALPEDFDYTGITATGPRGETINIGPAVGVGVAAGSASLSFEGAGMNRDVTYSDMKAAIAAGSKAAKAMAKIAEREAELAKVRDEAFDL